MLDFGLARYRGIVEGLTAEGGGGLCFASGTPLFMGPEQFTSTPNQVNYEPALDVYSLGVILFELLTGNHPYEVPMGATPMEVRRAILEQTPKTLGYYLETARPELQHIVEQSIQRDPQQRYLLVSDLAKAVEQYLIPPSMWIPQAGARVPSTGWILDRILGEGAVGQVWLARHDRWNEERVFKFCSDPSKAKLLKRESILYKLLSDKIDKNRAFVPLRGLSFNNPPYYLMMDYFQEGNVEEWVEAHGGLEQLGEKCGIDLVIQIAEGLQMAHDVGIIHRDVKPANILVRSFDSATGHVEVVLADFGLGQVVAKDWRNSVGAFQSMTMVAGIPMQSGTPLYMAPELLRGEDASIRSDIYSLGVILYQWLAGSFTHPVTIDWKEKVRDPLLVEDLQRCFAENPQQRFASALEFADSLRQLKTRQAEMDRAREEGKRLQRRAYWRGVVGASMFFLVLVGALSGLAYLAVKGARQAQKATTQALLEQSKSYRSSGQIGRRFKALNALERGNPAFFKDDYLNELMAIATYSDLLPSPMETNVVHGSRLMCWSGSLSNRIYLNSNGYLEQFRLGPRGETEWKRVGIEVREDEVVMSVVMSPDERYLAVLMGQYPEYRWEVWEHEKQRLILREGLPWPGEPQSWEDLSEEVVQNLILEERRLPGVAFNPSTERMAFGDWYGNIHFRSLVEAGLKRDAWRLGKEGEIRPMEFIAWDSSGQCLAASSRSRFAIFLSYQNEAVTKEGRLFQPGVIHDMRWHPEWMFLAVGCGDGKVRAWDFEALNLSELNAENLVGDEFSSGFGEVENWDKWLKVKEFEIGKPVKEFDLEGDLMGILVQGNEVELWDIRSHEVVIHLADEFTTRLVAMRNGYLVCEGESGKIFRWKMVLPSGFREVALGSTLSSMFFSPENQVVWGVGQRRILAVDTKNMRNFTSDEIPLLKDLVWLGKMPGELCHTSRYGVDWWSVNETLEEAGVYQVSRRDRERQGTYQRVPLAVSGDGLWSATLEDRSFRIFSAGSGRDERTIYEVDIEIKEAQWNRNNLVRKVAISKDAKWLAYWLQGQPNQLVVFTNPWPAIEAKSAKILVETGVCRHIVFSPDGQFFLASVDPVGLVVWDLQSEGNVPLGFESLKPGFSGPFALSGDGKVLATIHNRLKIELYSFPEGKWILELRPPEQVVLSNLCLDQTGNKVVCSTEEGQLLVWDLAELKQRVEGETTLDLIPVMGSKEEEGVSRNFEVRFKDLGP